MYDSRSNHGRPSKDGYDRNAEERFLKGYGVRIKGRPTALETLPSPAEAMEEALALRFDLDSPAMTFHRDCEFGWAELGWGEDLSEDLYDPEEDYDDEDYLEPQAPAIEYDDEPTDWAPWLPTMSYNEALEAFDGAFVIEGPAVQTSVRTGHAYMRTWELAEQIGIECSALIKELGMGHMRQSAVRHPFHLVAMPVAEQLLLPGVAGFLRDIWGPRKPRPLTWRQQRQAWAALGL